MKKERNQQAKISRIGASLEAGIILETTKAHVAYMPPLCLHGTFTTSGGFVVTSEFTTKDAIRPFSAYLSLDLHLAYDAEGQNACFDLFLECTEVALQNGAVTDAVEGWIQSKVTLRRHARKLPRWRKAARECWNTYLVDSSEAENVLCPCGSSDEFSTHFRVHAPWLWEEETRQLGKKGQKK
jgi:hypothetical protein